MKTELLNVEDVVTNSYEKPGDTRPMTLIRALRRDDLHRALQFNDYVVTGCPPKDELLPQVLRAHTEDGFKFPAQDWRPDHQEKTACVNPEPDTKNLGVFKLRTLCKERGLEFTLTDTKVTLLEKLDGGDITYSG